MYILGFVWFVLSLVKKYYLRQFSLFAWTHVALLCVVTQSYLIIQNMFEGLIWFIMPIMMVIINDIMAYMFGFTMGRTPLIQLSPKKTWEGFIGGGLATVVMSLGLAHFMCQVCQRALYHHQLVLKFMQNFAKKIFVISILQVPYFVCPIVYSGELK